MSESGARAERQAWLQHAVTICERRGLQLTPLRRQVLELLADAEAPLSAYAVLDAISKEQGKAAGPPTAYRALDFMVENGLAFKIASRNAYVRCDHLGHLHHGALLICNSCGRTTEVESPEIDSSVARMVSENGFKPIRQIIEIEGICHTCSKLESLQARNTAT